METAKMIKEFEGWRGDAALYKLSAPIEYEKPYCGDDPPAKKTDYVIVSAATVMMSGPETYIFPADSTGKVLNWGELDGSYRGGLSHKQALLGAGYDIE